MLQSILSTGSGVLILLGLVVGALVFVVPLFLPDPDDLRSSERLLVATDWGLSLAAALIGIGVLLIEVNSSSLGYLSIRNRFLISGFFFAIAGHRVYRRATT